MPPVGAARAGLLSGRDAIPDTLMFQNPIYQFWAGGLGTSDGTSPVEFPEVLDGLPNASANGDPTYNADYSGLQFIDYDGNDTHDWNPDSKLPTGSSATLSIFVVYYTTDNKTIQELAGYGSDDVGLTVGSDYGIQTSSHNDVKGGNPPQDTLDTAGFSYDVGSGSVEVFGGGSSAASGSTSAALDDQNHGIGYDADNSDRYVSGGIAEVVICDAIESSTDYSTFHSDRTS